MLQRKLFLGARLARLRRERGLNQSQMAEQLGISGSYLNHLERNQRPVTAGILLRLAEAFDVDVKAFASEAGDSGGATQLGEIFSDPMLADLGISRFELVELADNAPSIAEGIARLYTAVREVQRRPGGEERREILAILLQIAAVQSITTPTELAVKTILYAAAKTAFRTAWGSAIKRNNAFG